MKKKISIISGVHFRSTFLLILCLLFFNNAKSQVNASEQSSLSQGFITPVNSTEAKATPYSEAILSEWSEKPNCINSTYVKLGNLKDIQQKGRLVFNLPGVSERILAVAKSIKKDRTGGYIWKGDILNVNNRIIGAVLFIKKNDKRYGTITYHNRKFKIKDAGENSDLSAKINYIIEMAPPELSHPQCGGGGQIVGDPPQAGIRSEAVIEVLFLYTEAVDEEFDIDELTTIGLANLETALNDSEIDIEYLEIKTAGVELYSEYADDNTDANGILTDMSNSEEVASLRSCNNADLVVLFQRTNLIFVEQGNRPIGGLATTNPEAQSDRVYSVINATSAELNELILGHEIGHLLGCFHIDDDHAFANGYQWTEMQTEPTTFIPRKTIMDPFIGNEVVLRFSNPDANLSGIPTGAEDKDNARMIENTASLICDFSENLPDCPTNSNNSYTAFIDGPDYIYSSPTDFRWRPYDVGCYGSDKSYEWRYYFDDEMDYVEDSNGEVIVSYEEDFYLSSDDIPDDVEFISIELVATCLETGETAEYPQVKRVKNWEAFSTNSIITDPGWISERNTPEILIYPNPAADFVTLEFQVVQEGNTEILLINGLGEVNYLGRPSHFSKGTQQIKLDLQTYVSGRYLLEIKTSSDRIIKPLIIK